MMHIFLKNLLLELDIVVFLLSYNWVDVLYLITPLSLPEVLTVLDSVHL